MMMDEIRNEKKEEKKKKKKTPVSHGIASARHG